MPIFTSANITPKIRTIYQLHSIGEMKYNAFHLLSENANFWASFPIHNKLQNHLTISLPSQYTHFLFTQPHKLYPAIYASSTCCPLISDTQVDETFAHTPS